MKMSIKMPRPAYANRENEGGIYAITPSRTFYSFIIGIAVVGLLFVVWALPRPHHTGIVTSVGRIGTTTHTSGRGRHRHEVEVANYALTGYGPYPEKWAVEMGLIMLGIDYAGD